MEFGHFIVFLILFMWTTGSHDKRCPPGEYFDLNLPGCDLCAPMCPYVGVQDIPPDCTDICQTTTPPFEHDDPSFPKLKIIIAFACLSAIVAVCLVGLLVIFKGKSRIPEKYCFWNPKPKFPQQETNQQQEQPEDHSLHNLLDQSAA